MFQSVQRFFSWLYSEPQQSERKTCSGTIAPEGFVVPRTSEDLGNDEIIQDKLRVLKRSGLALPFELWQEFVVDTVVNYAMYCQDLPASESYHHAGKRGLLLHSLDVAIYAMRIRRNFILPPNTAPEDVIHREIVWVYGVFLCALLHDSGKINDVEIELFEPDSEPTKWSIALGPITQPYRCRYLAERQYTTHQYTGHSLLGHVLSHDAMLAISSDRALYQTMVEYLSGHKNPDNVISQIVIQADASSVAQDLGADKEGINLAAEKARGAPTSLASQLRLTLSHLLEKGTIPLNKKGAEGFVDGEHIYLMSKPIADRIRTALLERGITSVPQSNSKLFNELQQHNLIRPNEQDLAIWKCEVFLSEQDWKKTFTFICVHWPSLLPEGKLEQIKGHIEVIENQDSPGSKEAGACDKEKETAPISKASPEIETTDSRAPQKEEINEDLMKFMTSLNEPASQPVDTKNVVSEPVSQAVATVKEDSEPEMTLSFDEMNKEKDGVEDALEALKKEHILLKEIDLRRVKGAELGIAFCDWIDAVLKGGVHKVNQQDAMFHRVEQGLFVVSPTAFRTFINERCKYGKQNSYSEVQQGLQFLGRHIVNKSGRNVHKALVNQEATQALNGFVFPITADWSERYAINPHVTLENKE